MALEAGSPSSSALKLVERNTFLELVRQRGERQRALTEPAACHCNSLSDDETSVGSRSRKSTEGEEEITTSCLGVAMTSVMLKNIPNNYSTNMLRELLDNEGFSAKYDFIYLPRDFRSGAAFGYAFINLTGTEATVSFWRRFQGFREWGVASKKEGSVCWSQQGQGQVALVERYRNSSVMGPSVPEDYKATVFYEGRRVPFPAPTKTLSRMECPVTTRPAGSEAPTTLMLRNIPNDYTREMLVRLLQQLGFGLSYDFLYLPVDFSRGVGVGYAFVNCLSHELATSMMATMTNFRAWTLPSRKVAVVAWSKPNQGLAAQVQRYRNSNVMHPSVPDEFKPIVLVQGVRVLFPAPTRVLRVPVP